MAEADSAAAVVRLLTLHAEDGGNRSELTTSHRPDGSPTHTLHGLVRVLDDPKITRP
jgi:hypothetical protein